MKTEVDLGAFRAAADLRWHPFTVFEPGGGVDGDLIADGSTHLPLDVYAPDELTRDVHPPLSGGVGIVVAAPATTGEAEEALRGWCREQLGRDDVVFEPWDD